MDINNTPTLSQSIGQDNLGNIISALVDIFMLSLEQDYNGAIICIDEIDVSLHPDTQIKLLYLLEKVSSDLNIQFIISSHSLTILKEMLNKEKKNNKDYKVVYLKSPSAPYVTNKKSYELLKADMFQSLEFQQPKVKIYFEDEIGKALFNMLFKAFREIYKKLDENKELPCFKYCSNEKKYNYLKEKIIKFKTLLDLPDRVNEIITHLGCEELVNISDADSYFKRVIILLDGDARYKQTEEKPRIKDYLIEEFNSSSSQNDRKHGTNICFLPNYFAPESFLYAIIYKLYTDPIFYSDFWRTLDDKESTALFTPEKIKNLFSNLESDFNNDDLKKIFKEYNKSEVWKFIIESDLITYYYSKFNKIEELLLFLESLDNAYKMTLPLTLSNRYT